MKAQELLNNAHAKKATVDLSYENMIGIKFKNQHTWHWFEIYGNDEVMFDHSYSQNTGKVHRGTSHRMRIKESLGFYK